MFQISKFIATLAVLLCFSFAGQAGQFSTDFTNRLVPVIIISSSRGALG